MGVLLFIGFFWGLPMYLIDKRARRNKRSNPKRVVIAVLMISWGALIPLAIALALAGPGQRGWWGEVWRAWKSSKPGARRSHHHRTYGPYAQHPWQADAQQQDEQDRREEDEEQQETYYSHASSYDPDPDDW
jgi:hypothetical protein